MRYFLNHNYYNILYIITMSSFEDNIRKYVELDNQLKLINDELIISHPFKNYTGGSQNYNDCIDSITGNKDFSYCGVAPYNY